MNKYCGNCGHPLPDGAKFCVNCGKPVNARNEKQNIATESKKEPAKENVVQSSQKEPVKENANANSQKGNVRQKESGFISMLVNEVKDYLRHPQKLIPTIVLSVIWMVLPMITGFVLGGEYSGGSFYFYHYLRQRRSVRRVFRDGRRNIRKGCICRSC